MPSTREALIDLIVSEATYKPTPVNQVGDLNDDDIPYDPASAGVLDVDDDDDDLETISTNSDSVEEIYDPESAFDDEPKLKVDISNQLSRLERIIEMKQKQVDKSKDKEPKDTSFRKLPPGIADILFGPAKVDKAPGTSGSHDRDPRKRGNGSSSSTPAPTAEKSSVLGSMTDADLLAIAAAQLGEKAEPKLSTRTGSDLSIPPPNFPTFLPPPPVVNFPPPDMRPTGMPSWQPTPRASEGSWGRDKDYDRGEWHNRGQRRDDRHHHGSDRTSHQQRYQERRDGYDHHHHRREHEDRKRRDVDPRRGGY